MTLWLYVYPGDRVRGVSNDDMSGQEDWHRGEVPEDFVCDQLFDDHGAARYKLVDGKVEERGEEERMADWPEPAPMPVDPVRQLRADVDYIAMMMEVEL